MLNQCCRAPRGHDPHWEDASEHSERVSTATWTHLQASDGSVFSLSFNFCATFSPQLFWLLFCFFLGFSCLLHLYLLFAVLRATESRRKLKIDGSQSVIVSSGAVFPVCFLINVARQFCISGNWINIQIISIPCVAHTCTHKQSFSAKPSNCNTIYTDCKENTQHSLSLMFVKQFPRNLPEFLRKHQTFLFRLRVSYNS